MSVVLLDHLWWYLTFLVCEKKNEWFATKWVYFRKQSVTDGNDDEADYDADWIAGYEGASRRSTKKRKSDKVSSSPRVKGQLTKSKLQAGTARHTDQNENIHIDVVNGGLVLTPGAPESGSTPKIRIKSPFDPSLGTWEPATIEARPPDVSRKKSKHSGSKKKKRQNIAQNYSYTWPILSFRYGHESRMQTLWFVTRSRAFSNNCRGVSVSVRLRPSRTDCGMNRSFVVTFRRISVTINP